jgi:hypothetical protein
MCDMNDRSERSEPGCGKKTKAKEFRAKRARDSVPSEARKRGSGGGSPRK